jgi:hypothetical protein
MSCPFSSAALQRAPAATVTALTPGTLRIDRTTKHVHRQAAAITAPSPASAKIPNLHRPRPAHRAFVPPRLSYACGARNSQGKNGLAASEQGAARPDIRPRSKTADRGPQQPVLHASELCQRRSSTAEGCLLRFEMGGGDSGCGDDRLDPRRAILSRAKSIQEIARDLKVSRNTVRKVLRSGGTLFESSAPLVIQSVLPLRFAKARLSLINGVGIASL